MQHSFDISNYVSVRGWDECSHYSMLQTDGSKRLSKSFNFDSSRPLFTCSKHTGQPKDRSCQPCIAGSSAHLVSHAFVAIQKSWPSVLDPTSSEFCIICSPPDLLSPRLKPSSPFFFYPSFTTHQLCAPTSCITILALPRSPSWLHQTFLLSKKTSYQLERRACQARKPHLACVHSRQTYLCSLNLTTGVPKRLDPTSTSSSLLHHIASLHHSSPFQTTHLRLHHPSLHSVAVAARTTPLRSARPTSFLVVDQD